MSCILALDLGTTGNRAILFDADGQAIAQAYKELTQYYPQPGWLEHDASEIWQDTQTVIREVFASSGIEPTAVQAVGLTVQRETCCFPSRFPGHLPEWLWGGPLAGGVGIRAECRAPTLRGIRTRGRARE